MRGKNTRLAVCLVLAAAVLGGASSTAQERAKPVAGDIVDAAGFDRGLCVVLGWGGGDLPLELVRSTGFLVHVLEPDPAAVDAARQIAERRGLGLDRLAVEEASLERLPHADNLVDLLIAPAGAAPSREEMTRVLRPLGKALVRDGANSRWEVLVKPAPPGMDDWSHWEHGPDNNAVSTDAIISAPYMTQWFGLPYYIAMPAITTAAGGRTFIAMGHIAHHEREEAWLNTIRARNGYNGIELWQRRLPDGYLVHRSAFVATDDVFYMIQEDGRGCLMLDPETGDEIGRVRIPEVRGDWKWMALEDGILFALVGAEKDPAETTIVRSIGSHWSWGELSRGYYRDRVPWGFGETLLAFDLTREELVWTYADSNAIDSRGMAIGGGRVYFFCPDAHVGCLDATTGETVWLNDDQHVRTLIEEPGSGLGSTPGFRTTCFCVYGPEALVYQAQTRQNVVALSPDDGRFMWRNDKTTNNPNALYLDGKFYVGIGPGGSTVEIDPLTGEILRDLGFAKVCCVRLTATPDSLFCRGWPEGVTRYDRRSGDIFHNGAMRPACNDGVIGANGMLYIGPWLCDCNLSLMGTQALCSAGDFSFEPTAETARLTQAARALADVAPFDVSDADWTAYRAGTEHSASSSAALAGSLAPLWVHRPHPAFAPTAPVAAGGLLFLGGDDGTVRAFGAVTGLPQWTFATGAPIIQSPTVWNGRVYVGSGNGYVYCLEAATGRHLWRFMAAPTDRRIMVYGALCSTWPVNTGVVIHDGVAYAAAGIIDYDGTYVYGLDAITGEVRWQNADSGHLLKHLRKGISAQGNLTVAHGCLLMAGGNVVSPALYHLQTGRYLGSNPEDGAPAAQRGCEIGVFRNRFLVRGGRLLYSAHENVVSPGSFNIDRRTRDGRQFGAMTLCRGRIVPAWDDDRLVVVPARGEAPVCYDGDALVEYLEDPGVTQIPPARWTAKPFPGRDVVALAVAKDAVIAVHSTVQTFATLDPAWEVSTLNRDTGAYMATQRLPGPAIADGIGIDRDGRVVVALADGGIACYGGRRVLQEFAASLVREATRNAANRDLALQRFRETLDNVHDEAGRDLLIAGMADLGEDVFGPLRQAGCITTWRLIGPVLWDSKNPIDKVFIGEPHVDATRSYSVDGETLSWRRYVTIEPNGRVDLARVYGPHETHAIYAYAEVVFPDARPVNLNIGTNDGFKCWFNGKEVGRFDGGRVYRPDQDVFPAQAVKGVNRILLKVNQEGGGWDLGVRITDPENNPIDLTGMTE